MFEDFLGDFSEYLKSKKGPDSKKVDSRKELADWFMKFARACRAALPEKATDET